MDQPRSSYQQFRSGKGSLSHVDRYTIICIACDAIWINVLTALMLSCKRLLFGNLPLHARASTTALSASPSDPHRLLAASLPCLKLPMQPPGSRTCAVVKVDAVRIPASATQGVRLGIRMLQHAIRSRTCGCMHGQLAPEALSSLNQHALLIHNPNARSVSTPLILQGMSRDAGACTSRSGPAMAAAGVHMRYHACPWLQATI